MASTNPSSLLFTITVHPTPPAARDGSVLQISTMMPLLAIPAQDLSDLDIRDSSGSLNRASQDSCLMDLLRGSVDSLLRGSDDWVDVDCDGPGAVIFGADPAAASDNPSAPAGSGAAALEEDELAQQADASEEGIGAVAGGEGMVTVDAYRGAAASSGIQTTSTLQATLLLLKSRGRFIESSNRDCATLLIHAEHLQGIVDTSRSLTQYTSLPSFVDGESHVFLYYPGKRKPRALNRGGVWLEGSLALVMVCPDTFPGFKQKPGAAPLRPGIKFGGREQSVNGFGDLCVVVQKGSDVLGGYKARIFQVVISSHRSTVEETTASSSGAGSVTASSPYVPAPSTALPLDPGVSIVRMTPSSHEATTIEVIRWALAGHNPEAALSILSRILRELEQGPDDTHNAHAKRQHRAVRSLQQLPSAEAGPQFSEMSMDDLVRQSLKLIADHWVEDWDRIDLDNATFEISRRRLLGITVTASLSRSSSENDHDQGPVSEDVLPTDPVGATLVASQPKDVDGLSCRDLKASLSDIVVAGAKECHACTFHNPRSRSLCEVCDEKLPEKVAVASPALFAECWAEEDFGAADEEACGEVLDSDDSSDDDDAREGHAPSQALYGGVQTLRDVADVRDMVSWINKLDDEIESTRSVSAGSGGGSDARWMDRLFEIKSRVELLEGELGTAKAVKEEKPPTSQRTTLEYLKADMNAGAKLQTKKIKKRQKNTANALEATTNKIKIGVKKLFGLGGQKKNKKQDK